MLFDVTPWDITQNYKQTLKAFALVMFMIVPKVNISVNKSGPNPEGVINKICGKWILFESHWKRFVHRFPCL